MTNEPKKRTFFGKLWRSIASNSIPMGDSIVKAIDGGDPSEIITAISLDKEKSLTPDQKEVMIAELEKDVKIDEELTKRWESDNKQEHWLPKLIRPLVLANYTILVDIVILNGIWGKPLSQAFLPLLLSLAATVTGGYFALREFGKRNK
tara:strand:- start:41 stop:487 length:447 start_codon:yes stop_codon:yes gene_type:complete